ncbi:MAG TPA: AAA family ATPase [Candidatus Limnocylindrales bacterium]
MGQTVACANQKGGVGKTTTVVNLATYLALAGLRVLVIDLDPQGNATSGLGLDRSGVDRSIYDAVIDEVALADLVVGTAVDGLSVVPSSIALAGAEVELAPLQQRERRLGRLVAAVAGSYDYVFVDCPPSLGLLTVNALTAADAVLIPIQCEYYALEGLSQLIATVNLVRDHLNPDLAIKGVVLTMFDARTNLSAEVRAEVRRHLGPSVFETVIPRNVRLSEAPSYGLPIALYRSDSKGAEAYRALADELLARDGRAPARRGEPGEANDTGSPDGLRPAEADGAEDLPGRPADRGAPPAATFLAGLAGGEA